MNTKPDDSPGSHGLGRLGRTMTYLSWVLVLLFLTWGFGKIYYAQRNPNQQVASIWQLDGAREIRLRRNKFGHYVATGTINGQPVDFMLDTGATQISIPGNVARALDLEPGQPGWVSTAGGDVTVYSTRLEVIELGGIELHDIAAHINPHMTGEEILLGMSFLKEVDFAQQGDILIVRQNRK